jgi:hypothetical protein
MPDQHRIGVVLEGFTQDVPQGHWPDVSVYEAHQVPSVDQRAAPSAVR